MGTMTGWCTARRAMAAAMGWVVLATGLVTWGCQSSAPKPMAQPSVQDVKHNADRNFERLKQEERQGAPAPTSGY